MTFESSRRMINEEKWVLPVTYISTEDRVALVDITTMKLTTAEVVRQSMEVDQHTRVYVRNPTKKTGREQ